MCAGVQAVLAKLDARHSTDTSTSTDDNRGTVGADAAAHNGVQAPAAIFDEPLQLQNLFCSKKTYQVRSVAVQHCHCSAMLCSAPLCRHNRPTSTFVCAHTPNVLDQADERQVPAFHRRLCCPDGRLLAGQHVCCVTAYEQIKLRVPVQDTRYAHKVQRLLHLPTTAESRLGCDTDSDSDGDNESNSGGEEENDGCSQGRGTAAAPVLDQQALRRAIEEALLGAHTVSAITLYLFLHRVALTECKVPAPHYVDSYVFLHTCRSH